MASIPGKHVLEIETQLVGTVVRPGDKLIIAYSRALDMATFHEIRSRLQEELPGVGIAVIDQCAGLAVYREDKGSIHHPDNPHHNLVDGVRLSDVKGD